MAKELDKTNYVTLTLYHFSDPIRAMDIMKSFAKNTQRNIANDLVHTKVNTSVLKMIQRLLQRESIQDENLSTIVRLHDMGRCDLIEEYLGFSEDQSKLYMLIEYNIAYPLALLLREEAEDRFYRESELLSLLYGQMPVYKPQEIVSLDSRFTNSELFHNLAYNIWFVRALYMVTGYVYVTRYENVEELYPTLKVVDELRRVLCLVRHHIKLIDHKGSHIVMLNHIELHKKITFKPTFILENSGNYNLPYIRSKTNTTHRITRLLLFCIILNIIPTHIYQVGKSDNYFVYTTILPKTVGMQPMNANIFSTLVREERFYIIPLLKMLLESVRNNEYLRTTSIPVHGVDLEAQLKHLIDYAEAIPY